MGRFIRLLIGMLSVMLFSSTLVMGQSGDGHNPNGFLSYQPTDFSVNAYMLQQTEYTDVAKNTINNEGSSTSVFVNFTFDTSEKNVFIVYTTDGSTPTKNNGSVKSMSFDNYSEPNRTFIGTIPSSANQEGNIIKYVFYISDSDLVSGWGRVAGATGYSTSWTEGDDFYSYNVHSASKASGDFSNTATWESGSVPVNNPIEIVSPNSVILDTDYTGKAISILNGAEFTASDATARTLTIANSGSGNQSTFTNNGTWSNGAGGSTVVFTGAPSSGDIQHKVGGSNPVAFQDVTVNKSGGTSNVGIDFEAGTSVTGTLRIGSGGYVATAPPASFYGEDAILDFNQGTSANYEVNSGDNSWSITEVPNNITITSGTVTLNEARTLTGELLIESDAKLVTNENLNLASGGVLTKDGTVVGDINFLRELSATTDGFRLLSSPVETSLSDVLDNIWVQGITSTSTSSADPNVFVWDNSSTNNNAGNWNPVSDTTNTLVTAGTGFLVYVYEDDDYDGAGDGWPKTLSATGTENEANVEPSINTNVGGWTLLGNPFATTIKFDEINNSDLTGSVYIWDAGDGSGIEDGGSNNPGAGSWKTYAVDTGGDLTDGKIAPFQGFFVENENASPTVSFTDAAKTTGGEFYGKEVSKQIVRLEINGEGMSNSAWLRFSESGALQKTRGDALQLDPLSTNYAMLATQKGDGQLFDIAHLPVPEEEFNLPVTVEATKPGTYTLSATDFSLPGNLELYFYDRELEQSVRLDASFNYEFELQKAAKINPNPMAKIQSGIQAKKAKTGGPRFMITSNVSVSNEPNSSPKEFSLEQNYPNPFNPSTRIQYNVKESGPVTLTVYNVMGQQVETLVSKAQSAGTYRVSWNAASMASGIYYYRLQAGNQIITRQMTLIK